MPCARRLKEYLDQSGREYHIHAHPVAYTAQELAAVEHVPGKEMVKVVMLKAREKYFMTALPATHRVDLARFADIIGEPEVRLATELEFNELFPGCETGTMPPFGNLYGFDVYLDTSVTSDEIITFQGGSHRESIRMRLKDYLDLVKPRIEEFTFPTN